MALKPISDKEVSQTFEYSSQNLNQLLNANSHSHIEDVTTTVSDACFKLIQKSHLGITHYAKKHIVSGLTHATILAIPVAGLLSSIYFGAEHVKDLEIEHLSKLGVGVGAALVADTAIGKILGFRPITGALVIAYDAYREGARRLSKEVLNRYTKHEDQMQKAADENHHAMLESDRKAYTAISGELTRLYGINRNNIDELRDLRRMVANLKSRLPAISKLLSSRYSSSEVVQLINPIKDVIEEIQARHFVMREGNNEHEFNAKMLFETTPEEFEIGCLPFSVCNEIKAAGRYRGLSQTVYPLATALGLFAGPLGTHWATISSEYAKIFEQASLSLFGEQTCLPLSSATGQQFCMPTVNNDIPYNTLGIASTVIAAIVTGTLFMATAKNLAQELNEEAEHLKSASKKLETLYNGIADYIQDAKLSSEKIATAQANLKIFEKKLSQNKIDDSKITQKLKTALASKA